MAMMDNTTALEAIRDKALALPDADAGGGSGSIGSCSGYAIADSPINTYNITYTDIGGVITQGEIIGDFPLEMIPICGTLFYIDAQLTAGYFSGCTILYSGSGVTVGVFEGDFSMDLP